MLVDEKVRYYDFDGMTLDELRESLDSIEAECRSKGAVGDVRIEYDHYGYDGAFDIILAFKREETEKERTKRVMKEEREKEKKRKVEEKKRQKELKELERLKKKYEKVS